MLLQPASRLLPLPPAIKPPGPALAWWPIFAILFDSDDLQPVEPGPDTLDRHGAIEISRQAAARLKLPFPAFVDRDKEPISRSSLYDAPHCVKRA
tara:strand:- start:266 stop:550 length:285 start_codon:yes stop_codon:yes gene_type:complete